MIARRLPFLVVAAAVAALLVVDSTEPAAVPPSTFGESALPQSTPAVFDGNLLSTSWFCPGGPTVDGRTTSVTVLNTTDDPREVTVSAVTDAGLQGAMPLDLPPRNRAVVNLGDLAAGVHTAATVAVYGGGVAVEQTVVGRSGVATSPCADRASSTWYLADGTTTADASLTLVLYNPFPDDAVVDIALTTVERTLEPPALQGAVVPGQSVRLVDIGQAAQREEVVSTVVRGRGSRLVVGRIQSADNAARRGFNAGLAAAQAQQTWWFPDGDKGDGVGERFIVFNPGDFDASVELSFLPAGGVSLPPPATPDTSAPDPSSPDTSSPDTSSPDTSTAGGPTEPSTSVGSTGPTTSTGSDGPTDSTSSVPPAPVASLVPPVSVVVPPSSFSVVDVNTIADLPPGPHSTLVNVVGDDTPVVVERLLTRPLEDTLVTNVLLGSQITVPQWYVIDEAAARGGILVVMNSAGLPTTSAVKAIGPAGAVPVPGLEAVPVPAGGSVTMTIPETVGGFPLLVEGAQPIVVEWRARAQAGDRVSRVDALAFPVIGG